MNLRYNTTRLAGPRWLVDVVDTDEGDPAEVRLVTSRVVEGDKATAQAVGAALVASLNERGDA